ncbi:MAG TPA: hypothetical protein VF173_05695 [Thermoanaerobaculia bacterium]|nr:hypothetical protein [Thermoanaerobaculia bacterium]
MPKSMLLCVALLLGLLAGAAALAQAPAATLPADLTAPPQTEPATTPLLEMLDQAVDSSTQPKVLLCSPPTIFFCVNQQCECQRFICAHCGIKSFTCDENTHQFSCICKSC